MGTAPQAQALSVAGCRRSGCVGCRGKRLRLAAPNWSLLQVAGFAILMGLGVFLFFGVIYKFVGDPPKSSGDEAATLPPKQTYWS